VDSSPDEAVFAALSEHLREEPEFLAGWLAAAPDRGEGIIRRLGLDQRQRARLPLYRSPRAGHFIADVTAIARHLHVDPDELAVGLREGVALAALAAVPAAELERPAGEVQAGLVSAAHDMADDQVSASTSFAGRARERADSFWADVPDEVRHHHDLEVAIAWATPLAIVALPALDQHRARGWLASRGVELSDDSGARALRGLLLASRGAGIVFLDGRLTRADRRFTVAHELGHFLFDYVEPRERVLREAPELLDVIDGWRPPSRAERAQAVLARVPLGLHAHLLERDADGGAAHDVEAAEDAASQFALELLAPWSTVLELASATAHEHRLPFAELIDEVADVLADRFTLPRNRAAVRARSALHALGIRRSFFDR
jgi:hypothetical protein